MKPLLRAHFLSLRASLSPSRRQEAEQRLFDSILAADCERVASFTPMRGEIDLTRLNQALAAAGRLLLPKLEGGEISFSAPLTPRDLLLVPGLAFDDARFRLGYGKGCYDRYLARHPDLFSVGVGFTEQRSAALLPRDPWDLPVRALWLF